MFQGLGDLVGGASGGTKASTGFGKWYSQMQEDKEVREQCSSHIFAAGVPCIVYLAAEVFSTMVSNPLLWHDIVTIIARPERAKDSFSVVESHGTFLWGVGLDRRRLSAWAPGRGPGKVRVGAQGYANGYTGTPATYRSDSKGTPLGKALGSVSIDDAFCFSAKLDCVDAFVWNWGALINEHL